MFGVPEQKTQTIGEFIWLLDPLLKVKFLSDGIQIRTFFSTYTTDFGVELFILIKF